MQPHLKKKNHEKQIDNRPSGYLTIRKAYILPNKCYYLFNSRDPIAKSCNNTYIYIYPSKERKIRKQRRSDAERHRDASILAIDWEAQRRET